MIDPSSVHAAARKKETENLKFRTFLKNHADCDELDQQFLQLHNELFSGYDCCRCANCCKAFSPVLQENELGAIASFLGLTEQALIKKYFIRSSEGYVIDAPCCFLGENGKCAIQERKPTVCGDFPYTDKPERMGSLHGVMSFAEQCPVVFEIVERLKIIYCFKPR